METEVLYQQGLARAIEIVDANASRFDAEVSRESAKLAMEQAYLDVRFALGLGPVDEEGSEGGGTAPAPPPAAKPDRSEVPAPAPESSQDRSGGAAPPQGGKP